MINWKDISIDKLIIKIILSNNPAVEKQKQKSINEFWYTVSPQKKHWFGHFQVKRYVSFSNLGENWLKSEHFLNIYAIRQRLSNYLII